MLVASKSGLISAVSLIKETDSAWIVMDEKTISKTDTRKRAFDLMSDALKWSDADSELIKSFLISEAKAIAETESR